MKNSSKNGSVLLIVMCFVVIAGGLVGAILASVMNETRLIERRELLESALTCAEAGLELAAKEIVDNEAYYTTRSSLDGTLSSGSYTTQLNRIRFRTFQVISTGTARHDDQVVRREVVVDEMFLPTYGKFGWWTQINGNIWFIPGDVLYGATHTDDVISLACWGGTGPIFRGPLTSLATHYLLYSDSNNHIDVSDAVAEGAVFDGGFMMGSDQGSMAEVPWTQRKGLASDAGYSDGIYLEGPTEITFQGNLMRISNDHAGLDDTELPIGSETLVYVASGTNGLGTVALGGGTVNGDLTIFAEDDMTIEGHIYYANDPRDDSLPVDQRDYPQPSDDKLGLISMDDILIPDDCPNNLTIFAAMMATGIKSDNPANADAPGMFGLDNYANAPVKGTLTVYGSIIQEKRGPVGTFGRNGIASGFFKNYGWDERFGNGAPAHFPTMGEDVIFRGWRQRAPTI